MPSNHESGSHLVRRATDKQPEFVDKTLLPIPAPALSTRTATSSSKNGKQGKWEEIAATLHASEVKGGKDKRASGGTEQGGDESKVIDVVISRGSRDRKRSDKPRGTSTSRNRNTSRDRR